MTIDGETAYILTEDLDDLLATPPTNAVRLLPGHDQWVIGPGTKDQHVVPPARRTPVTRKANLVIAGGTVSGTWTVTANHLTVTWFGERETRRGRPSTRKPPDSPASSTDHSRESSTSPNTADTSPPVGAPTT
ncbi:DNA glycosylase AlkZ-like family protein [Saccharothrix ecbatanensis]|uniref:DNA glycosylase AlkZ-like family protein n=1 Tax=Saccharothrix ecbatanensis TaxID=1105145 RepID=UPI0035E459A2